MNMRLKIKGMAFVAIALAAVMTVACSKEEEKTNEFVGTKWVAEMTGELQGIPLTFFGRMAFLSADSLRQDITLTYDLDGYVSEQTQSNSYAYSLNDTVLTIYSSSVQAMTYCREDDTFKRSFFDGSSIGQQMANAFGSDYIVFHREQ